MNAIIISIGDELIFGQTLDTNAAWLAERLTRLGITIVEHLTVGDNLDALCRNLSRAGGAADVIIATGGLGPTDDDLTRHGLAQILGVELSLHQPWLEHMQDFFARLDREMSPRNRIQAMIPQGCDVIPNPAGTACGLSVRLATAQAFFLPGVPDEMKAMFDAAVQPVLAQHCATDASGQVFLTRTLHCFGTGESNIAQMLGDIMARNRNPLVNITASQGTINLRIIAHAHTQAAAAELIQPVESELRHRLGQLVFGSDGCTLAQVVADLLTRHNCTIGTAESCTGGLLAQALTDVPGASRYFRCGWVTYSNQAKIQLLNVNPAVIDSSGAVSAPVAEQLAQNARRLAAADYAVSTTGIAGPSGSTGEKPVGLVFIGLATADNVTVERCMFPGNRPGVRRRAVYTALDLLRRQLS